MVKIAFVVSESNKVLYEEIQAVVKLLEAKGIKVESPCYLDEKIDWKSYDLISFNSCDGYYKNPQEFQSFLKKISPLKGKIFNPTSIISWNLEKNYLIELAEAGFDVAKTIWVAKDDKNFDLEKEITKRGWIKFIVKPSISAGSFNTAVFEIEKISEAQDQLKKITANSAAMIQEFMPEVVETGEYSAFFFDKKFSHLILKTPAKNDFRAGLRQGAQVKLLEKNQYPTLVETAQNLVDYIKDDLLYARVDMVKSDKIYIMELELIEPLLYLNFGEGLLEKYAAEICAKIFSTSFGIDPAINAG